MLHSSCRGHWDGKLKTGFGSEVMRITVQELQQAPPPPPEQHKPYSVRIGGGFYIPEVHRRGLICVLQVRTGGSHTVAVLALLARVCCAGCPGAGAKMISVILCGCLLVSCFAVPAQ